MPPNAFFFINFLTTFMKNAFSIISSFITQTLTDIVKLCNFFFFTLKHVKITKNPWFLINVIPKPRFWEVQNDPKAKKKLLLHKIKAFLPTQI